MTRPVDGDDFFIGWRGPIGRQTGFLVGVAVAAVLLIAALGLALGGALDDAGAGPFRVGDAPGVSELAPPEPWDFGAVLRGRVTDRPYRLLHVAPDAAHPQGRTLLLSGAGKTAAPPAPADRAVELAGGLLRRGSIEMLSTFAEPMPLDDVPAALPPTVPLGRWRVVGEICDGKCAVGAMRPGMGLAHRACANLCLNGEVPPVFATAAAVAGARFLLLADADGGPLPAALLDLVARPVELEGEVERWGNLLIFKVDLDRARVL